MTQANTVVLRQFSLFDIRVGRVVDCQPFKNEPMMVVTVHIGRGKFVTMMQSFLGNNITKEDLMRDNVICINTIRYESKSPLAK